MTDVSPELLQLKQALTERHSRGEPPVVIEVESHMADEARRTMAWLAIPEAAYVLREKSPEPRINRALPMLAFSSPAVSIGRERAPNEDRVDELLNRYRHNDPEAAARIRAERLAKRAARNGGAA